jgi:hypothetical protein
MVRRQRAPAAGEQLPRRWAHHGDHIEQRVLDHQPRVRRQAHCGDAVGDGAEQRRRDGEVVDRDPSGPVSAATVDTLRSTA